MKSVFFSFLATLFFFFIIVSCQKEFSQEVSISKGSLKSDSTSDCLPSVVNGVYTADSTLNSTNYIDVQVNASVAGSYLIQSDSVNGFSFKGTGIIGATGLNTIRLQGVGKPVAAGLNTFTIRYDTTFCSISVQVVAATANTAAFTLADASGACTGVSFKGIYKAGVTLDTSNYIILTANVTKTGNYAISTAAADGITFSGTGVFTATGSQQVTLKGSGIPVTGGNFNLIVGSGVSNCSYSFTVLPATPAAYTLTCTPVTLAGSYTAGTAMDASNTAKISAVVTAAGSYTITTTTVNGVTFSATSTFAAVSATPQTVTLTSSGVPTAAGTFSFPVTGGGSTCSFSVTFKAAPTPAVFTLSGAPNACTTPVINGTYIAGTALAAANTVIIKVDVTTPGTYTIATATVNGITFSATGTFANSGTGQAVTLTGTGTPAAAATSTFKPVAGSSSCTFDIPVTAPSVAAGIYTCKIDGVFTTFNEQASAGVVDGFGIPELYIDGFVTPANGNNRTELQIFIVNNDNSAVKTGTYNGNGFAAANGYTIEIDYVLIDTAQNAVRWNTSSSIFSQNPPFTITVTSISATRVKGTFSGQVTNILQGSTQKKTITEGVFDVPLK